MSIRSRLQSTFFIICFFLLPLFLKAQEGNHCAVKKSPYRLSMDSGKKVYSLQCVTCHQADGLGVPNLNPALNSKKIMGDKNKLIGIVINGSATHEEINGIIYNNTMAPNPGIKDQEIADVLTYIRNSFGNKVSMVRVSDVKSVRSKLK
jgi:mono/diheme cytochrome c family protein